MIKINLLGSKIEQNPYLVTFMVTWIVGLTLFFLGCIFWKISLSSNVKSLEEKNNNLKSQLAALEEKTKEVNKLNDIKEELRGKLKVIDILKKSKLGPVKLLDNLNIALPSKIWLESIEESNQNIIIAGKSLDDPSLSLFMKALEYSPYFSNVDLNYSKQFFMDEVKIKDFEIKANVSYSAKEDDNSKLNNKEKK